MFVCIVSQNYISRQSSKGQQSENRKPKTKNYLPNPDSDLWSKPAKLLDAVTLGTWPATDDSIPGAELKMHGVSSLTSPIASPLKPGRRKISITTTSISPTAPCRFVSGFRSIAMPQPWVDRLLPVRCGRKAKHPPKLVILVFSPRC